MCGNADWQGCCRCCTPSTATATATATAPAPAPTAASACIARLQKVHCPLQHVPLSRATPQLVYTQVLPMGVRGTPGQGGDAR